MSRTPMATATDLVVDLPPEPPGLQLSDLPLIEGRAAASRWFRDELGVVVAVNRIKTAQINGELPYTSLGQGGKSCYATRDLWRWIVSRRRQAVPR